MIIGKRRHRSCLPSDKYITLDRTSRVKNMIIDTVIYQLDQGAESGGQAPTRKKKSAEFFFQSQMFSKNDINKFFELRVNFKNLCIN